MSTLAFVSSKTEVLPKWSEFAEDLRRGLTKAGQKELHSKYFYDDLGSALFEAITVLPEYGLTRADARILRDHSAGIIEAAGVPLVVAELGSGTGQKTRFLLKALRDRQPEVPYRPIDVSRAALDQCARDLESFADVRPIQASYLPGVRLVAKRRSPGERLLVLFLGSTIGNFEIEPARVFLKDLRKLLKPDDCLLLGTDLVKPAPQLLDAYDDPTGVTAAFNLNILARANRELGADFNLRQFEHLARYNPEEQRIEMYLRSRIDQRVTVPGADCAVDLAAGETIWTESSHKYRLEQLEDLAVQSGFKVKAQWLDHDWPFAESLWIAN